MLIELSLVMVGVMAEALQVNIEWKAAFLKGVCQFPPNFHVVGDVLREPFLHR